MNGYVWREERAEVLGNEKGFPSDPDFARRIPSLGRARNRGPNAMSGKKETVLDLGKFIDKGVRVKLSGGREVTGTLKGVDQLLNLVLDECVEYLRDVYSSSNSAGRHFFSSGSRSSLPSELNSSVT